MIRLNVHFFMLYSKFIYCAWIQLKTVAKTEGNIVSSALLMKHYHHSKLKICLSSFLRVLLTLLENITIPGYFTSQS